MRGPLYGGAEKQTPAKPPFVYTSARNIARTAVSVHLLSPPKIIKAHNARQASWVGVINLAPYEL